MASGPGWRPAVSAGWNQGGACGCRVQVGVREGTTEGLLGTRDTEPPDGGKADGVDMGCQGRLRVEGSTERRRQSRGRNPQRGAKEQKCS